MEAVIQHVQQHMAGYIALSVCIVPLLYVFREITKPVFFYTFEIILYAAGFHLVFGGLVRFFGWFRDASSFEHVNTGGVVSQVALSTPMKEFWVKELYSPITLYYVECAALAIIIFIVVYFRPLGWGQKNKYVGADGKPAPKKKPQFKQQYNRGGGKYRQRTARR